MTCATLRSIYSNPTNGTPQNGVQIYGDAALFLSTCSDNDPVSTFNNFCGLPITNSQLQATCTSLGVIVQNDETMVYNSIVKNLWSQFGLRSVSQFASVALENIPFPPTIVPFFPPLQASYDGSVIACLVFPQDMSN